MKYRKCVKCIKGSPMHEVKKMLKCWVCKKIDKGENKEKSIT